MVSSSSNCAFSLLIFSLFIQITISIDPLFTICPTSYNFTTNSPYQKNLQKLLGDLYFKTPPTGFGLSSSGHNQDRAYGLSLCRGDASIEACTACVVEASSAVTKRCPNSKEAIIWYDNCYLKYSDNNFFGKIDYQNRFYMWNLRNITYNVGEFNKKTEGLLRKLSEDAMGSSRLYAEGDVEMVINGGSKDEKIYGMVQCSRDLSKDECKKCVDDAVAEFPLCCEGREGGRVVGGSCSFRYEIYPFLH